MRPFSSILGLALVTLAAAHPAQGHVKGYATARMTACATAEAQAGRYLVVQGSMKAARGASRMQMRFVLQSRTPERRAWRELAAPGLGLWNTADPSARRYVYEKRVEALAAPGRYRMVVQFRWLEGDRRVAQQRRVTRICRQPDLRPDLVARKLAVRGGGRYVIRVANRGLSSSGPFAIVVAAGATTLASGEAPSLAPKARAQLELVGAPCPRGSAVSVRVDADGRVGEPDEGDNEVVAPCRG